MAIIFTRIQRKVSNDEFNFLDHCLDELADENFKPSEAVSAVLSPFNYFSYTDDESHVRYAFEGFAKKGRMLRVIVFLQQGRVKFKSAYEIFK